MTPGSLSRCVGALLEECQKFEGERTLMRIHIGESEKWRRKPLYEAIVEMLRKEGFSGATVLRRGLRWLERLPPTESSAFPRSPLSLISSRVSEWHKPPGTGGLVL